jgi:hypothetical protein
MRPRFRDWHLVQLVPGSPTTVVRHAELHATTLHREREVTAVVGAFDPGWQAPGVSGCERVEGCNVRK